MYIIITDDLAVTLVMLYNLSKSQTSGNIAHVSEDLLTGE